MPNISTAGISSTGSACQVILAEKDIVVTTAEAAALAQAYGGNPLALMLVVVFAKRLSAFPAFEWLAPVGRLAWPWYVPLGTLIAVGTGMVLSYLPRGSSAEGSGSRST